MLIFEFFVPCVRNMNIDFDRNCFFVSLHVNNYSAAVISAKTYVAGPQKVTFIL